MSGAAAAGRHTLYGSLGSGSAAVEVALRWAGVPFTLVRASTWEPDSALDALAQVNPLRQIPTLLLPDGTVLTESAAILIHLGLTHPDAGLLPGEPGARARALRGLVYIAANCYAAVGIGDHPQRWLPGARAAGRERLRQGARAQLHHHWTIFADQFPLSARAPGALELLAAVVSKWSGTRAHLHTHRPHFLATLQRIEGHRRVAPVLRRHWPD